MAVKKKPWLCDGRGGIYASAQCLSRRQGERQPSLISKSVSVICSLNSTAFERNLLFNYVAQHPATSLRSWSNTQHPATIVLFKQRATSLVMDRLMSLTDSLPYLPEPGHINASHSFNSRSSSVPHELKMGWHFLRLLSGKIPDHGFVIG